jgi:hypothetical protein
MPYPTADELIAGITGRAAEILAGYTAEQKDALRDSAIDAIERYTRQSFLLDVAVERILDGTGTQELWLPARLEELTAIAIAPTGIAIDLPTVTLNENRSRLSFRGYSSAGWAMKAQAQAWGVPAEGRTWPATNDSVHIIGDWGWPEIPTAVITALRMDIEDAALADDDSLTAMVQALQAQGVKSMRQRNLALELRGGAVGDETVVSPRVQRQLAGYVWDHIEGAVA